MEETATYTYLGNEIMVREERFNSRDLRYSNWHRTLPDFCYMIDLDCVEWRSNRGIVAFIETALRDPNQTMSDQLDNKSFEVKVLHELFNRTDIPTFIVFYSDDLNTFWIFSVDDGKTVWLKTVEKTEYEKWIQTL